MQIYLIILLSLCSTFIIVDVVLLIIYVFICGGQASTKVIRKQIVINIIDRLCVYVKYYMHYYFARKWSTLFWQGKKRHSHFKQL